MQFKSSIFLLISAIAMIFFSCKDFIETDISDKRITIYTPADSTKTTVSTQTFLWKEVDGAIKYNIQIVNGTFSQIQGFIADTNLISPKFVITLQPGTYQWRIKALNSTSATAYQTYNLQIDTTSNLNNQTIILSTPSNNSFTNINNQNFSWSDLYNATQYNLQITKTDFSMSSQMELDTFISANGFAYTLPMETIYKWRVKAINNSSETPFSAVSTITVDLTDPDIPTLLLPLNRDNTVQRSFDLDWKRTNVGGSSIIDSLYVYSDTLGISLVSGFPVSTVNTTYSDSLNPGYYSWQVRSKDAAGNVSDYSSLRWFRIQ